MQGSGCCEGETSEAFPIRSGVKQGCVLEPTLFGIFFSLLLSFAFAHLLKASTYTLELTANSSTLPACGARPK